MERKTDGAKMPYLKKVVKILNCSPWYWIDDDDGSYFYCQRTEEGETRCKEQCDHCREYYKPLVKYNMKANIIEAFDRLLHLHCCEQEGIQSGQPTPEEWFKAVEDAEKELINLKELLK